MTRRQSRLLATTTLAATLLWLLIAPAQTSMELAGTRTLVENDIEVVYQAPASTPRGVLLILHGCSHRATDAWPKSDKCPECTGLPIETRVVAEALARNWAVAAVTSHNRRSGCWSQRDIDRIAKATGYVRRVTNAGPATVSLGPSSGGSIAVLVPDAVACVAQIMASPLELDARHPPVRFVHMSRDTHRAAMIHHQVSELRDRGVDAAELIVEPEPLSAAALFRRGAGPGGAVLPSREMAERAFQALRAGGFVDASGFLVDDPRRTNWRDAVRPQLGGLPIGLLRQGAAQSCQLSLGGVEQGGVLAFQVVIWPQQQSTTGDGTSTPSLPPPVRVVVGKVATEDEAGPGPGVEVCIVINPKSRSE